MLTVHTMAGLLLLWVAIITMAPRSVVGIYPWMLCGYDPYGGFVADSDYKAALSLLAATMPKNASMSPGHFATGQAGVASGDVWALAFCQGDANTSTCYDCLQQTFEDVISSCDYKDATIYYDSCLLAYSNIHFRADDDTDYSPTYPIRNLKNATKEPEQFQRIVAALMNATASSAAFNSSTRLYASGQAEFDKELPEVYAWAQCTPDLSPDRCWRCLVQIMRVLPTFMTDAVGGRVLGIRCNLRYETQPFFPGPVTVQLSATSARPPRPAVAPNVKQAPAPVAAIGEERRYSVPAIILMVVVPTLAVEHLIVGFFIFRRRPRSQAQAKQPSYPSYSTETVNNETIDSMWIDIATLRAATEDFAESNKLGEGGFGVVYKGSLRDGEEIAVKRLSKSSTQGVEELRNELTLVAKLKHKNLVRLVGFCLEQQERLVVYEFVCNRSLDQILFDTKKREQLDWGKRQRIIRGIARGLQYLHEDSQPKVVHRDLKASNVLLDADMNPKISDFGLARLFGRGQTQGVTNEVVGTYGYMAPEYVMRGNYSVKSDVFSFGVMVLEIVTGRKNSDTSQSEDLLTTIWEHWAAGTVLEAMDPCMNNSCSESDVMRCIQVGLLCVQENPVDRPLMSAVAMMMLGSNTVSLGSPSKPAFTFSARPVPTLEMGHVGLVD
ncbi:cysteine-rich receptor-like protein kinase 6 isoform X2 [Hordeum vulgare subsp. vulgare]|nr:cysteine-rich receptor-like protein kinase 6 isoform X2 [Hordeum vulgare subsp. vulgare]